MREGGWNFLLQMLAFSFESVLRIPFSLSGVILKVFLRDLINDQVQTNTNANLLPDYRSHHLFS